MQQAMAQQSRLALSAAGCAAPAAAPACISHSSRNQAQQAQETAQYASMKQQGDAGGAPPQALPLIRRRAARDGVVDGQVAARTGHSHRVTASRPATPEGSPCAAPSTPTHAATGAAAGDAGAAAPQQGAAVLVPVRRERRLLCAAPELSHTQPRVASFLRCLAGSPLLQSALFSLELALEHPPPAEAAGGEPAAGLCGGSLEWTLAQLLALFLRAGEEQAGEAALLSALWVLESAHSAWRSPATVCLNSYLKWLGLFSPELVHRLTADWEAAFASLRSGLVDAQAELLRRLDWRVRLDWATDVEPCHRLLSASNLVRGWCAGLRQQVGAVGATLPAESAVAAESASSAAGAEGSPARASKRQRLVSSIWCH